ncbi:hypothetical protein D3Y57_02750 (plasmid) [Sphingomonas paeninsulae]|uniref:Uncharacterized protein n=1 Tax=Sphingomonas paeninsulae TaxID=2319844 RepID=A0A494T6F7_SPHPE|nr:hypothetical protein [Sphingomonas paeninsulae]AYJ84989.1 hypothetical protein D3Y57_02750 [Sphingomonas paeninsulae]
MNFVQLLSSLDELLYELMSWLIFFPITLWRILRYPLATMRYAEEQLLLDADQQYRGTVSPPIMLILTVALVQAIGIAIDGGSAILKSRHGLAALVNDNTSLLLLRLLLFGTFALVLAARKVRRSGAGLDRDTLKPAFYAQCYAISPFTLLFSAGTSAATHHFPGLQIAGVFSVTAALLFYGIVQVRWFSRELNQPLIRSFIDASIGMVESVVITIMVGLLFV